MVARRAEQIGRVQAQERGEVRAVVRGAQVMQERGRDERLLEERVVHVVVEGRN